MKNVIDPKSENLQSLLSVAKNPQCIENIVNSINKKKTKAEAKEELYIAIKKLVDKDMMVVIEGGGTCDRENSETFKKDIDKLIHESALRNHRQKINARYESNIRAYHSFSSFFEAPLHEVQCMVEGVIEEAAGNILPKEM